VRVAFSRFLSEAQNDSVQSPCRLSLFCTGARTAGDASRVRAPTKHFNLTAAARVGGVIPSTCYFHLILNPPVFVLLYQKF